MTPYQHRQVTNAYFELLHKEGIPEEFVREEKVEGGKVVVTIITGKTYSQKIKVHVEASGNVREGLVSRAGGSLGEPSIQRDWAEATHDGEARSENNS